MQNTKNLSDYGILVISSDKYQDLWNPFFKCFHENWIDCPFDIYLGSNTVLPSEKLNCSVVLSGNDLDWSTSTKRILSQIQKKFLLVVLEDFFIISQVNTDEIISHFEFMAFNSISHMHFKQIGLKPDYPVNETYEGYAAGAPYRVNVFGFWNTKVFMNLLLCGETPWEFEIMGSYRSKFTPNFLAIIKTPFDTLHMVEKGKFFNNSFNFCKNNSIEISQNKRETHNLIDQLKSALQIFLFSIIKKISWEKRLRIMDKLRKILISY
jgi:hypothetical protein